jgi:hypothetical protein
MEIINGKWVDKHYNPIDNFNVSELIEIGQKVKAVYGDEINYDRISVISSICKLTGKEETNLAYLLEQEGMISKLSGY